MPTWTRWFKAYESSAEKRAQKHTSKLTVTRPEPMFWHLLPTIVIGGQMCRLPPLSTEECSGQEKAFRWENGKGLARNTSRSGHWPEKRKYTVIPTIADRSEELPSRFFPFFFLKKYFHLFHFIIFIRFFIFSVFSFFIAFFVFFYSSPYWFHMSQLFSLEAISTPPGKSRVCANG